jgi:hypothetical protein
MSRHTQNFILIVHYFLLGKYYMLLMLHIQTDSDTYHHRRVKGIMFHSGEEVRRLVVNKSYSTICIKCS